MRKTIVRLLPIVVLSSVLVPIRPSIAATQAWPMFQHDLQHTGRTSLVGPAGTQVLWTFPLEREPGFPISAADGTIYLPTGTPQDTDGFLYAINPNGTQKWRLTLPGGPASSAPAIGPDGTIYLNMNGGEGNLASPNRVWAVNPDGTRKWENDLGTAFTGSIISSPAVASDGGVWVGSKNTVLYKLSPTDGSIICGVSPSASSITSSVAIGPNGTVYVIDSSTHLFAVDQNCNVIWEFQLSDQGIGGANDQSPAIAGDGTIWAPSIDDHVYAINPNGTKKCRFLVGPGLSTSPAIGADGTIYINEDGLFALNPTNCTQKWHYEPFGSGFKPSSPIVDGSGHIYIRAGFGDLYSATAAGTERWSLDADHVGDNGTNPAPLLSQDGVLYLADGGIFDTPPRLRAIGGSGTTPSPSPTATSSPTPSPTATSSPSPSPTSSASPTASPSPTATALPTPSPSPTASPTAKEVLLKASRTEVPRGRRARLVARVFPCAGHEGHFVKFQKKNFFGWKTFAKKGTDDLCKGRVRVRIWKTKVFRAVSPRQDDDHLRGVSNRIRVRVIR